MNFQIERLKQLPLHPKETWQGGLIRAPGWIVGEERKPYRSWMALWVSVKEGFVHHSEPVVPEERNFNLVFNSLVDFACDKNLASYMPGKIEVQDAALAEHLSGLLAETGIQVVQRQKLIYLDRVIEDLIQHFCQGIPVPGALEAKGVTLEMMQAFAEAASQFYQAQPWQHLSDEDLIEIEEPVVDSKLRYVTVMGQGGQTYGLSFFRSRQQYDSLYELEPEEFFSQNEEVWSLTFEEIMDMPFADADLWEDHELAVAGDKAYPVACSFGRRGKYRRPGPALLAFMEGLLRALAQTTEEEMDTGRWQKQVNTYQGMKEFRLVLPDLLVPLEAKQEKVTVRGGMPDRRALEQEMANLQKILSEQEFSSTEEINAFLNQNYNGKKKITRPVPDTPLEKAQDLVYQAFNAIGRRQMLLARKALEICPDCADAYVILAERTCDLQKSHDLYLEGILAGERALGRKFFKEEAGRFWGLTQTRPYMRARLGLAQCLEGMDRAEEAAEHYRELLRLNPNDNQGVRDLLLPCLLRIHQDEEVEALLKKYKDDKPLAMWSYTRALVSFCQQGQSKEAQKDLQHALQVNRYVADFLLDEDEMPERLPGSYQLGSEEEAAICAGLLLEVWRETPGAIEWLEKYADGVNN